jgi:hypothetical protein
MREKILELKSYGVTRYDDIARNLSEEGITTWTVMDPAVYRYLMPRHGIVVTQNNEVGAILGHVRLRAVSASCSGRGRCLVRIYSSFSIARQIS